MRRYPYLRGDGSKERICVLCESPYMAKYPTEAHTFCPACFTKERKHEIRRLYKNLWRAKRANAPATLTIKQWLAILDHFEWKCVYCPGNFEILEHIVSISNNGGTTALNCVPACLACNSRKDNCSNGFIGSGKIEHIKQQLIQIAESASDKSWCHSAAFVSLLA